MGKRRQTPTTTDRKPPADKDRSNQADRDPRKRRSGEGADSALANWKSIERDRERSRPVQGPNSEDDDGSGCRK
jgi:hypothetical protein